MSKRNKPVALLILDGWGHREATESNAIALAKTPNWDHLWTQCPHTLLSGSGQDVGLPKGQMGNSEVGHLCMGSGRIIYQDLERINHAVESGSFDQNTTLLQAFQEAQKNKTQVHVMGLLSPGGVHSHQDHFLATLNLAKKMGVTQLYLHAFLDGRDTPPKSAKASLILMDQWFKSYGHGQLASLCGRYYAMDRDKRYERTQLAYDMLTQGSTLTSHSAQEALEAAYQRSETDEFVMPTSILHEGKPIILKEGDVVVFMNFRADRARQLSYALTRKTWEAFPRKHFAHLSHFVTMTQYADDLDTEIVFPQQSIPNTLGALAAAHGLRQLRVAETEKYAHVTFFFNGGIEQPFDHEERTLIPSPKVATYDLKPEMSAPEVTKALVAAIKAQQHDLIICNYANADMVGHTGNLNATIEAIEVLDRCLGQIMEALQTCKGEALITSDHGNAEMMENPTTHQAHTAHTTELVPLVYFGPRSCTFAPHTGTLADVAPTLVTLLSLPKPQDMTGKDLLQCHE